MPRIALPLLAVLCSLVLLQCDPFGPHEPSVLQCTAPSSATNTEAPSCSSQTDRREAQLLAVWLTGELRPDTLLTRWLCRDLNRLRREFADEYPVVANRRFQTAWVSGKLTLRFDSAAAQAIRENRYEGWGRLPPFLRPDTLLNPPDERGWSLAGFDEVYHMGKVGAQYEKSGLPGLRVSGPTGRGFAGFSTHPILPLWNGKILGLVFTASSTRPPNFFFRVCSGRPEFVDQWNGGEDEPRWLRAAWEAWESRLPPPSQTD